MMVPKALVTVVVMKLVRMEAMATMMMHAPVVVTVHAVSVSAAALAAALVGITRIGRAQEQYRSDQCDNQTFQKPSRVGLWALCTVLDRPFAASVRPRIGARSCAVRLLLKDLKEVLDLTQTELARISRCWVDARERS
jgi:hypothetical protein